MDELPHDDQAERAVLGAVLFAPDTAKLPAFLNPTDFYRARNQRVYAAFVELQRRGQPFDILLLVKQLEEHHELSLEDRKELGRIQDVGAVSRNIQHYARIVREHSLRRLVVTAASELVTQVHNGGLEQVRNYLRASSLTLDALLSETKPHELEALDLANLDTEEPIPWVVQGWAGEQDIIVCGAEGGMGKSVLGMDLALALATGSRFANTLQIYGGPYRVLMVDEEMAPRLSRFRLRQLIRGRGLNGPDLPLRYLCQNSLRFDNQKTRDELEHEISTFRPAWVILDTLIRFHAFDENSNTEMARIFNDHLRPLRASYGCGFVVHHHLAKPSKERTEVSTRLRGAGDVFNQFDDVWALQGDRHTNDRTLSSEKCRWRGGSLAPPIALHFEEAEDQSTAKLTGIEGSAGAEDVIRQLVDISGADGVTRTTILASCEARGIPIRTARRALERLDSSFKKEGAKGRSGVRYFGTQERIGPQ